LNFPQDIKEIRTSIREAAENRWGGQWAFVLAQETGWTTGKVRTLVKRGKHRGDITRLQTLLDLRSAESDPHWCEFLEFVVVCATRKRTRRVIGALAEDDPHDTVHTPDWMERVMTHATKFNDERQARKK